MFQLDAKNNEASDLIIDTNKRLPKIYVQEEIDQLLSGFVELPKAQWKNIAKGDFLRYQRCDGNFRRGGFILSVYADGLETKLRFISDLNMPPSSSNPSWVVKLSDLNKIWSIIETKSDDRIVQLEKKTIENASLISQMQETISKLQQDLQIVIASVVSLKQKK